MWSRLAPALWSRLSTSELIRAWVIVTVLASVVAVLDSGFAAWAAFIPSRIFGFEIWRLVTWPFVADGPVSLVGTCIALVVLGGPLATRWGDHRLRRFATEVLMTAAIITCVVAVLVGQRFFVRFSGWAVADVLVIAYARQFPERPLTLFGLLTVSGNKLVQATIAITAAYALYMGVIATGIELVACAAAALYPRSRLRG